MNFSSPATNYSYWFPFNGLYGFSQLPVWSNSNEVYDVYQKVKEFAIYFRYVNYVIGIGGILANILNLWIFRRMGLQDSVTFILFNIAIADLLYLVGMSFVITLGGDRRVALVTMTELGEKIKAVFGDLRSTVIIVSSLLTTFLAVQRCLCVVKPLHFKGMFTRKKNMLIVGIIWVYCLLTVLSMNIYILHELSPFRTIHVDANSTRNELRWFNAAIFLRRMAGRYRRILYLVNGVVISFICQVILVACVFIMLRALRKSAKFRSRMSASGIDPRKDGEKIEKMSNKTQPKHSGENTGNKERKVIIQVTLVSMIFITAHLHYVIYGIFEEIVRWMVFEYSADHIDIIYNMLDEYFYTVCSSVNIFVYLKYNTRFKKHCIKWKSGIKKDLDKPSRMVGQQQV